MRKLRTWVYGLLLAVMISPLQAELLQISQLTSVIPSKENITCRVVQDRIYVDLNQTVEARKARVTFIYEYDFHFNPIDDAWLVTDEVDGHESIEIDLTLIPEDSNSESALIFNNPNTEPLMLQGRVRRGQDKTDFYYQRPAKVNLELLIDQPNKKASVFFTIRWMADIPGYGVYVDGGAGIAEKLDGQVSSALFHSAPAPAKAKRSPRNPIPFPSVFKTPDADTLFSPQIDSD